MNEKDFWESPTIGEMLKERYTQIRSIYDKYKLRPYAYWQGQFGVMSMNEFINIIMKIDNFYLSLIQYAQSTTLAGYFSIQNEKEKGKFEGQLIRQALYSLVAVANIISRLEEYTEMPEASLTSTIYNQRLNNAADTALKAIPDIVAGCKRILEKTQEVLDFDGPKDDCMQDLIDRLKFGLGPVPGAGNIPEWAKTF